MTALGRCAMGIFGEQCPDDAVREVRDWPMCAEHAEADDAQQRAIAEQARLRPGGVLGGNDDL